MWMPVFPRDIDFALATAVAGVALLLVVMLNLAAAKSVQPKKIAWLLKARELIVELIREKHCHPLLVRLAWHDAGTYDQQHAHLPWPAAGGAIGSVRFSKELNAAPNGGLSKVRARGAARRGAGAHGWQPTSTRLLARVAGA